jgi:hypothetical protein
VSAFLSLRSNAPGATELVLVNGEPYVPWVLAGVKDLGGVKWQHQFSGARGTQGRRAASGVPDDRQMAFGLLSDEHADKDALAADLSDLAAVVDEMRRFGGLVTFREHGQSRKQRARVMVGEIEVGSWETNEWNLRDAVRPVIRVTCAPYLEGEPMEVHDEFAVDSIAAGDWRFDAGTAADVTVTGGALAPAGSMTSERRLVHVGTGYILGDQEAQVEILVGSTVTGFKAGVVLKVSEDGGTRLEVTVEDDGTTSRIRARPYAGGTAQPDTVSNLPSRIQAGQRWWLRAHLVGTFLRVALHNERPEQLNPDFMPPSGYSFTQTVEPGSLWHPWFGVGTTGRVGIVWVPRHSAARLDDFRIRPFLIPSEAVSGGKGFPRAERMAGVIPGDAPATGEIEWWCPAINQTINFALAAWWARPRPHNLVMNGGFEGAENVSPWTAAAVTNFMGAATSVTRDFIDRLFGAHSGEVVCPATANTGAKYPLYRAFRKGERYRARAWVMAPSATTNVRLRIGDPNNSSAIASSTASALSTTWTLREVTWTCTADTFLVWVGVEITAATATVFNIDGVSVEQADEPEPSRGHREGEGALPPFGVIEAEAAVRPFYLGASASGLEVFTSANDSGGRYVRSTSNVGAGGATYELAFLIDPSLVVPDDYAGDAVSFVVWARVLHSAAFTGGMKAIASMRAGSRLLSYTTEHGEGGYIVPRPATSNAVWRITRMGTLVLPVSDLGQGVVELLTRFEIAAGTNGQRFGIDYVALTPARAHVASATGKGAGSTTFATLLNDRVITKRVRSDTSAEELTFDRQPVHSSGLGGAMVEVPPGEIEMMSILSGYQPDNTIASDGGEAPPNPTPRVRLIPTPRWHYLREP